MREGKEEATMPFSLRGTSFYLYHILFVRSESLKDSPHSRREELGWGWVSEFVDVS